MIGRGVKMSLSDVVSGICLSIFIIFLIGVGIMSGRIGGKIMEILRGK